MASPVTPPNQPAIDRRGLVFGLGAYICWGLLPLYFKLIAAVPAVDIVAHRVAWSVLLLILLVTLTRGWPAFRRALASRRTMLTLTGSAALIGANWLLYVWAVNNGHVLASSLGYYLNPIANILLGRFMLKEHLSRAQWLAVGLACVGIAVLAAGALGELWISLSLCATFAFYGLLRKIVAADALTGLIVETMMLLPIAFLWLWLHRADDVVWASGAGFGLLVAGSGLISTIPLLLFAAAARRIPYSTMGILQFVAPTLQFLLAVFAFGEPFTRTHAIAFAAIWTALAIYVGVLIKGQRAVPAPAEPA